MTKGKQTTLKIIDKYINSFEASNKAVDQRKRNHQTIKNDTKLYDQNVYLIEILNEIKRTINDNIR